MPPSNKKLSVLLDPEEAERFDSYCKEKGFKKSSLVARLIREHLAREGYRAQQNLFHAAPGRGGKRR